MSLLMIDERNISPIGIYGDIDLFFQVEWQ
jgi:hypothetical protein